MDKNFLYDKLAILGLPMFTPDDPLDVNKVLFELVESHDHRLFELFPVVLAAASDKEDFSLSGVEDMLPTPARKETLYLLCCCAQAVYMMCSLSFQWLSASSLMQKKETEQVVETYKSALERGEDLVLGDHRLSAQRVSANFKRYYARETYEVCRMGEADNSVLFEHALSRVFSARQKELFLKKIKGEKFTKTEREYYSRAVKPKVVALANQELHQLANTILKR
jgi:hypothetical protein